MVDSAEEQVQEAGSSKPAHSGWNLKKTGSGGRSGRVTWETLSVVATVKSDNNSDDAVLPDAIITLTQPAAVQSVVANTSYANSVTFSVSGTTVVPSNSTLTYQWQVNNNTGGTWVNVSNGLPANTNYTGGTTNTLTVKPADRTANNYVFRAVVTATNAGITNSSATVNSSNGRILIS